MAIAVLPRVQLATDDIFRGPWVFSRQVQAPSENPPDGALVEVLDLSERFVGHAFYNSRAEVRLRWVARGRRNALARPVDHFEKLLRQADRLRRKVLDLERSGDTYRLLHGEGDGVPGLVIDRLGPVLVCEHHALGAWRNRALFEEALRRIRPELSVVHRVPRSALGREGFDEREDPEAFRPATEEELEIRENDLCFLVRPATGHKTGWFCDQRENRRRIAGLSRGRGVLDLCTNAGGFAIGCAHAGARSVRAVDLDEDVLARARASARRNGVEVAFEHADAFPFLRRLEQREERFELVIVDPPKLIMGRAGIEAGKKKYADLNTLALGRARAGGLVATFSCSGALDRAGFLGLVFQAARRARREVQLLEHLDAGPDHPQDPDWPRSGYLKGALLHVRE